MKGKNEVYKCTKKCIYDKGGNSSWVMKKKY